MSGALNWQEHHAAIWRSYSNGFKPVADIDPIALDQLSGVEPQAASLCANTEALLAGERAEHALLWGARGCGKSSLVKAVFNYYRSQGLRLVEVDSNDLAALPAIVDALRAAPQSFVIFIDDIGFDKPSAASRSLKVLLEGSIELPPKNIVLYLTANRRHLLSEGTNPDALHPEDENQERLSLADRFGLNLSFYAWPRQQFLDWIGSELNTSAASIALEADLFATKRGARNGRVARQFVERYRRQNLPL